LEAGPIIKEMKLFFEPESVVVVGASRNPNKPGYVIFRNFLINRKRGIFKGKVYPVNQNAKEVLGERCYPSVLDVPSRIDLLVVAVPAEVVPRVLEEAGRKGVRAAIIISSGFSEVGNYYLEEEVKRVIQASGIRTIGPNGLGVYDSYSGVDTLFLPETRVLTTGDEVVATPRPMAGNISMISQSGAFSLAALDYFAGRQMGISKMVSFGNKIDVGEPETLTYLSEDEKTRVILLYVEGIERGREFLETARKVTLKKPIVALKTGRTEAGARAARSHTGAMVGTGEVYKAAFLQAGIIQVRDMNEFFNAAKALASQPPVKGDRIGLLTDAGGPAVMAIDECEIRGLRVEPFTNKTIEKLTRLKKEGIIPSFAAIQNPIDLTGSATSEMFEECMRILLKDEAIDAIILIGLHHVPTLKEDYVDRIAKLATSHVKPIVACDIGETEMALYVRSRFDKLGIPAFASPEAAVEAMDALVKYGRYLIRNGVFERYIKEFSSLGK